MNIYDMRQIKCISCDRFVGEVQSDAVVLLTRCGACSRSDSSENEVLTWVTRRFENTIKNVIVSH
ncbi:MAG: hypothetical protein KGI33_04815 [Thaumarchaeota archaeon]|nr:hypothetical protein [Nitrososphaerota archaeon]